MLPSCCYETSGGGASSCLFYRGVALWGRGHAGGVVMWRRGSDPRLHSFPISQRRRAAGQSLTQQHQFGRVEK